MSEDIVVCYRWTLAEFTAASRWHLRQMPRVSVIHFVCWALAGVCGVVAVLTYRRTGDFYLVGWFLLGAIYFLSLLGFRRWLTLWRMRRNYAKSTSQDAEIEWRIGEDKLWIKPPTVPARSIGPRSTRPFRRLTGCCFTRNLSCSTGCPKTVSRVRRSTNR